MPRIIILHTNDFHDRLTPARAALIGKAKRAEERVLLLDAGDAIRAGNIGWTPGGEPILRLMTQAGYDAMCVGNREFHLKARVFPNKIADAGFPVISASIRRRREDSSAFLPPRSVTLDLAGVKVGVFGVTVPMIVQRMLSARLSDYVFDQPLDVARTMAGELRAGVEVLIALTHVGRETDREIAQAVPEIDIVIGGHDHRPVEDPTWVGDTPVVAAGFYARHVGRAEIEVDGGAARLVDWRAIELPAG
jgi:2',3'-cyclic-nucleotide 2'-phosphodiesterase (5'-nucleotidase family)